MKSKELIIRDIYAAFAGVKLGNGISWRETDVIDNYGRWGERERARALDEKTDWTAVPLELIGDRKYSAALSFLDLEGLKFYLPACMIYHIREGETSDSIITDSTVRKLTLSQACELRDALTPAQVAVVRSYLRWYLGTPDAGFDGDTVRAALGEYWS